MINTTKINQDKKNFIFCPEISRNWLTYHYKSDRILKRIISENMF